MGEFHSTLRKKIIRVYWDKPLLRFLHERTGRKLIYMGLPSPSAEDIDDWIEHIDKVIAFQCRNYPQPSAPDQDRKYVQQLQAKLTRLEREKKITYGFVYDGYIEEVIAKRKDNMDVPFSQQDVITIYNLDFCNQITSPQKIVDPTTKVEKEVYKLHTIRDLLEIQSRISSESSKFVMFLTIHSSFWDKEASKFLESVESQPQREYHHEIDDLEEPQYKIRLLKSYIFETLKNYFCDYQYVPEFLPVINYKGPKRWLLHFTILGTRIESVGRAVCVQRAEQFLKQRFITASNKQLMLATLQDINEDAFEIDSARLFTQSQTYQTHWNTQHNEHA